MVKYKTLSGTYIVRRNKWGKAERVEKVQEPVLHKPYYMKDTLEKGTMSDYETS